METPSSSDGSRAAGGRGLVRWLPFYVTAGASLLGLVVMAAAGWGDLAYVLEALAYPTCVAIVIRLAPAGWNAGVSRPTAAMLLAFWALFVLGQFIGGGNHTFPFIRYSMFTDEADSPSALRIELTDASGRAHHPDPRRMLTPLTPNRQMSRFRRVVIGYERDPDRGRERLEELLRSLALLDAEKTHRDYVEASVQRLSTPRGGRDPVAIEEILTIRLEGAP